MNRKYHFIFYQTVLIFLLCFKLSAQTKDEPILRELRTTIHVFQDSAGGGNFSADSSNHIDFLYSIIDRLNYQFANLDSMKPSFSSGYIRSIAVSLNVDTIYFVKDNYAWNSDSILQSDYMDSVYIKNNSSLNYEQKHKTLHIFIAGNYNIVGGHVGEIGDKRFIATRGFYNVYKNRDINVARSLCWRNLIHETGHTLGLKHNFSGGPSGDQCDDCDDNGCPEEGTSNNIMDYWPGYGFSLSECQAEIVNNYLSGLEGNISHTLINDSCYRSDYETDTISDVDTLFLSGLKYMHSNLLVKKGVVLIIKGTVSFPQDCSLFIESGAKVIVDGGVLTNLCGDLWNGIILLGNPHLDQDNPDNQPVISLFNNSVVENSKIGIMVGSAPDESEFWRMGGGGLVEAANTIFRNNVISIKFLPYGFSNNSNISFCSFENTRLLNHFEEGYNPKAMIEIYRNTGLSFQQNTFINHVENEKNYENSGIGILSMDASYKVNDNNVFNGLLFGIQALTSNKLCTPDITGSVFINNYRSILVSGASYSRISGNYFELRRSEQNYVYGLCLENCTDYIFENNEFFSSFGGGEIAGIIISGESLSNDLVYKNTYQNLPVAIFLHDSKIKPAIRKSNLINNDIDLLITNDTGKGMGFANIKFTPSFDSYTDDLKGGYNTFYRSDHIPIYYNEEISDSSFDISDKMFFSDPFPQLIDLPDPNPSNNSLINIRKEIQLLEDQTDSLLLIRNQLTELPDYLPAHQLIDEIQDISLPPVILLQKIVANPQLMENQGIKKSIEERFGNIPAYMLQNIENISSVKPRYELISDKISVRDILKHQYSLKGIKSILENSLTVSDDTITQYLVLDNNHLINVKRAFINLLNENYDNVHLIIEKIRNQVELDDENYNLLQEYANYLNFIVNINKNQKSYFALSEDEIQILENLGNSQFKEISLLAGNIIKFIRNDNNQTGLIYPDELFSLSDPIPGKLADNESLRVYPNPANELFMVEFEPLHKSLSNFNLEILDTWGRKLYEYSLGNLQNQIIYTTNFQSGLYFCKLSSGGEQIAVKKIIILKK